LDILSEQAIFSAPFASATHSTTELSSDTSSFGGDQETKTTDCFSGIAVSPGVVLGVIYPWTKVEIEISEVAGSLEHERALLSSAMESAFEQLKKLEQKMIEQCHPEEADIFKAHQQIVRDPVLKKDVEQLLLTGNSASIAWHTVVEKHACMLESLDNQMLRERATDIRDVGQRVQRIIMGVTDHKQMTPVNAIVIAEELTPSDMVEMDGERVLGICTLRGGATSHVAILAQSLGIPAVFGVSEELLSIPAETMAILDGTMGMLRINLSDQQIQTLQLERKRNVVRQRRAMEELGEPTATKDGQFIAVMANVGQQEEISGVLSNKAAGIGLLRSEFLFINKEIAPSEKDQTAIYSSVLESMGNRPVTIRTLDVGGDKPLDYLPLVAEENPFLGVRGIRIGFKHPQFFRSQLRALLLASTSGNLRIMFPMITTISEFRQARALLQEEAIEIGVAMPKVGVMVEVPAVALMAEKFAQEVDFFSIGTNDLTQFTLAMDRGNAQLAEQFDALHPSVLRLIAMTTKAALKRQKSVAVCGNLAFQPEAIPILLGLGIQELSVVVPQIPMLKARIRDYSLIDCENLASQVLEMDDAAAVRSVVKEFMREQQK
jgi:phosphocarrier protein FPr